MDTSQSSRYTVISTDGHCGANLWDYKPYLEKRYHDEFDAWATTYEDAWGKLDPESADNERVGVASFLSPVNWESSLRLEHLESQGITAEVLFPNTSPPFFPSGAITAPGPRNGEEYELRNAGIKAHNRWLVDFCGEVPGRRAGLAQVFLNNVDDAVKEARWAKENGLMGLLLPPDHLLQLANLYYPKYEVLWATCAELNLPVHRHPVTVAEAASEETGVGAPAVGLLEGAYFGQRPLQQMIIAGIFERHPNLKFVLTELTTAWAVPYLKNLDEFYLNCQIRGTIPNMFGGAAIAALSKKPSEYFRSNCYLGSFLTAMDIETRHSLGIDRLMWGADYPHHEGTSPYTREAMRFNFADVPEAEVRRLTSVTAADCYGFDLEYLHGIADRIGPTVEEIAMPLGVDEIPSYPDETICPTFAPFGWR